MQIAIQTGGRFTDKQRDDLLAFVRTTFKCEADLGRHHPSLKRGSVIMTVSDIPENQPGTGTQSGPFSVFGRICHPVDEYLGKHSCEVSVNHRDGLLPSYKIKCGDQAKAA